MRLFRISLLFCFLTFLMAALIGCGPLPIKPDKICPGKKTVLEAFEALTAQQQLKPLLAKGQCLARIRQGKKLRKEQFRVKLWLNPPSEVRFFGEFLFNERALDIGSNEDKFWAAMKPDELGNSFYWGRWDEQRDFGRLILSPKILMEGLGIVKLDEQDNWSFSNESAYDVLTKTVDGKLVKKIYIYSCLYLVRKIEYYDEKEKPVLAVRLDDYRQAFDGCFIPCMITVSSLSNKAAQDSFEIKLNSIGSYEFTEQKRKIYFELSQKPAGFKHIYRIVDGELIEQL